MRKKPQSIFFAYKNLTGRFLFALILLAIGGSTFAQSGEKVTIKVKDVPIRTALDNLRRSTQIHFMYEEEAIPTGQRVTLDHKDASLTTVLNDLCKQTSLRYEIRKNVVLLFPATEPEPKQKAPAINISGKVSDENGEELIGVNIMAAGTTQGVITDKNGQYSIKANPGDVLLFSYIGMDDVPVKVQSGKHIVDVIMKTHHTALSEVVVTGYQTLSKERVTGAYSVISAENTKGKLETNILSRIEGQVPGMNRSGYGNDFVIRGISTYLGGIMPLYIVDGVPFEGEIASINYSDIQNITVLKDAAAASIYGARSANGVIVITTKSGQVGATKVAYSGSMKITPKPDWDYFNLVNSSELVDLQIEGFNYYHAKYAELNRRYAINPVIDILYQHERGKIDDLEKALSPYRNSDNRRQIEKEFMRIGLSHQHSLSISGGTERNQYIASLNYAKMMGNEKDMYYDQIGFTIKNNTTLYKWLLADMSVSGNFNRFDTKSAVSGIGLIQSYPSYYMLRDADGKPLSWPHGKSEYELERLKTIGLMDETYFPINEKGKGSSHSNTNYYRIQAGLLFKIAKGLSLDLKYQTENEYKKNRNLFSADSWNVKTMINNAAQYNSEKKELKLNVPEGGQLSELRQDSYSYTFRAQMNFARDVGAHSINAIAGAERRLRRDTGVMVYYMGYDDNSLSHTPYDPLSLKMIAGTESMSGFFTWSSGSFNQPTHFEERYVSFYGNASYTYDSRYSVTGSIRVDKSDLYATDSKKQNRPLWSIGGSWHLTHEKFMQHTNWINLLNLRATYGIGGNIPKRAGPYMNIVSGEYNDWIGAIGSSISNPPNPLLGWEKTATVNLGVDFSLFNHRLRGGLNYYNKKTTDILGYKNTDPTLGWASLLLNYGEMTNSGVEVDLQSTNIQKRNFSWQTNFVFSYNKNKLTNLEGSRESVFDYSAYSIAAVGYPLQSIFSYRYAGLSRKDGSVLVYNKEGEKVKNVGSVSDMVYSGTREPKYTASLKNSFSYKDFDLSFMFVYYGGHVLRDVVAGYLGGAPNGNISRKALNRWRKPGDEKIPGVAPAFSDIDYINAQAWYSADIHVKKADYIKLRDVSLIYNIPKHWLRKYNLEACALTCQIGNLWWWAKNGDIDPEAYKLAGYGSGGLALPNPVTYTFGLSINF